MSLIEMNEGAAFSHAMLQSERSLSLSVLNLKNKFNCKDTLIRPTASETELLEHFSGRVTTRKI